MTLNNSLVVETNFVVDVIHNHINSCHLFDLACSGAIELIIPEICLLESISAALFQIKDRTELGRRCHHLAKEIEQSGSRGKYRQHSRHFIVAEEIINQLNAEDENRIKDIVDKCRQIAVCLPLTAEILILKEQIQLDSSYGRSIDGNPVLTGVDALIYGIILNYAKNRKTDSGAIFLSRDSHFNSTKLQEELRDYGVEFKRSPGEVIKKLR